MRHFVFSKVVFLVGLVTVMYGLSSVALAQPSSCDHQIMDAMESKAYLHGQRRVAQNANLILKPDSVLEYSCFDQFIGHIAANPDVRRFSEEDTYWGDITAVDATSLDLALGEKVMLPLLEYLRPGGSYGHTYLGGRTVDPGAAPPTYGQYTCDAMAYVWDLARCFDFADEAEYPFPAYDFFYDFPFYTGTDPRVYPPNFAACTPSASIAPAIAESHFSNAKTFAGAFVPQDRQLMYVLSTENPLDHNIADTDPYEEDLIIRFGAADTGHNRMILPGACTMSAAVPTGVVVERPDLGFQYDEAVCSVPGCSWNGLVCN